MDDPTLDAWLKRLAQKPPPALPPGFDRGVWDAIAHRRTPEGGWEAAVAMLFRPLGATAALLVVLVVSVNAGFLQARSSFPRGLGLEVFSIRVPALPSTRLTGRR
ncbi:MAG TPA: hypothetical protein VGD78_04805 [Chthoniobacterales bacterium]